MTQDRPAQCGRTIVHGRHDTTEGWCPGLHPDDVRPPPSRDRNAAAQRPLPVRSVDPYGLAGSA